MTVKLAFLYLTASSGLANCAAAGNAIMMDATLVTSIKSFFIMNSKIVGFSIVSHVFKINADFLFSAESN